MPDFSPIPNITSIESTDIVRVWRYVDALGGYRMFEISGANLSASFDGGGSLSVTDGSTTVDSVTALDFSGATVTDGGAGEAEITVSGGGSSGFVRTASGAITDPVAAINYLSIGAGCFMLKVYMSGITTDAFDLLILQFSDDGGATWHEGGSDYYTLYTQMLSSAPVIPQQSTDSSIYLTSDIGGNANISGLLEITIFPGGPGLYPEVLDSVGISDNSSSPPNKMMQQSFGLGVFTGRQNAFRIACYPGDDVNLTGGSFSIYEFSV